MLLNRQNMNTRQAIEWAGTELSGLEDPRLEAELLLAYVLDCDRSRINAYPEQQLNHHEEQRYRVLIRRASRLEPLAYLTGKKEFFGHSFLVNRQVLIPRPETEELVELALQKIEKHGFRRILDVGTGSGAIALSLAAESPAPLTIDAIDKSVMAIKVAGMNRIRIRPAHEDTSVNLIASTLDAFQGNDYDMVVSNPPYIPSAEITALAEGVREYEPHLALDGGTDGLDIYRLLAKRLPTILADGGICLCEVHSPLASETAELFKDSCPGSSVTVHKDLQGRLRIIEISGVRRLLL
ncbi:MAG: Release factor glutamine methyltransferase [candidate division WS6 bacterium OLB20]|uniref:Release factor glutamine methyltransferase n=1 Tax=candidate division WS6 bacterium OLB20 TaxID=1617426 RepID=A0A136LYA9_9BACT|nr:MAG: Release factor glutamine methyltransferase [candidate division WS6 bacterium OLB20]